MMTAKPLKVLAKGRNPLQVMRPEGVWLRDPPPPGAPRNSELITGQPIRGRVRTELGRLPGTWPGPGDRPRFVATAPRIAAR